MKKWSKTFLCIAAAAFIGGCSQTSALTVVPSNPYNKDFSSHHTIAATTSPVLRVATWNVEHLAYPIELGCRPRTQKELVALKAYAKGLEADVVALQEVASSDAIHLLFPEDEWQVVMSQRPDSESYECRGNGFMSTQQKVAFAIRKPLMVASIDQVTDFGLNSRGLRYGLAVSVKKGRETIELLNLHLKSGCFVDDYQQSDSSSCQTFAKQVPILDSWIEQREKNQSPYVVLGDFNHRLSAPYNRVTRTIETNENASVSTLDIATRELIGCHPRYPAPIDHIMVGALPSTLKIQNVHVHRFNDMNEDAMLSDHCAVSLELSKHVTPLSTAVKWQTTSQEYQLITEAIYDQASKTVLNNQSSIAPWVVVMDVDETILDNSAYQVWLNNFEAQFTEQSWNDWVKSGQASLIPGAKAFIETVIAKGGKLALITNRNKELDSHTWTNMQALNLPINERNTCLMGRTEADKTSVNNVAYVNDKDLRREQLLIGNPNCFSTSGKAHETWQTSHNIVMHIGDNIEDIDKAQQETPNTKALLKRWGEDVFILPNPMYGSW